MVLPLQVLEKALNTRVELVLKDKRHLAGTLLGFDEHMNLVVAEAEEPGGSPKLGTVVVRGSNIVSIHPK